MSNNEEFFRKIYGIGAIVIIEGADATIKVGETTHHYYLTSQGCWIKVAGYSQREVN